MNHKNSPECTSILHVHQLMGDLFFFALARRISRSHVIIKRSTTSLKNHTRAHISDDITHEASPRPTEDSPVPQPPVSRSSSPMDHGASSSHSNTSKEPMDEISRIRQLLRPPPIPGLKDWGIPLETQEPCDPAIAVRYEFESRAS